MPLLVLSFIEGKMYATPAQELAGTPPGVAACDALQWKVQEETRKTLQRASRTPPPDVNPPSRP